MLAFGRTTGCIVGCTTQASGEGVSSNGYHQIISPKNETDELHLIHNLAIFNQRFLHPPFALKKLIFQDLKSVVQPGEWLVSLNPRDTNRHFTIHNNHHRFLQSFKVHYEWKGLLLNMSMALHKNNAACVQLPSQQGYILLALPGQLPHEKPLLIEVEEAGQLHTRITFGSWLDHQHRKVSKPTQNMQFIRDFLCLDLGLIQVLMDRCTKIQIIVHRALAEVLLSPKVGLSLFYVLSKYNIDIGCTATTCNLAIICHCFQVKLRKCLIMKISLESRVWQPRFHV